MRVGNGSNDDRGSSRRRHRKREKSPENNDSDDGDEEFTSHRSFVASPSKPKEAAESSSEIQTTNESRKRELESELEAIEVIKRNKPSSGGGGLRQNYLSIIQEGTSSCQ